MIKFFANLFGYFLNYLYNLIGNYGLAIIVFSIIIKLFLLPISIKQQKTMKKTAKIQGQLNEIKSKYANDPERLNQETMELYKKENMSPFSGCLGAIIQIILLFAVFYLVRSPLTYMKKVDSTLIQEYTQQIEEENSSNKTYPEISIIRQKGNEDENVYINMNFLGLDLSKVPNQNLKDYKVYIIPLLYVITSFISIKLTNNMQQNKKKEEEIKLIKSAEEEKVENIEEKSDKNEAQEEVLESMQDMTKSMSYMMPMMAIMIAFIAPLGLALYWLISNSLMIVERLVINKFVKEKEEQN